MRTFTIRAAAAAAAERIASKAATASTSALARIGVDKVMALFPSRRAAATGETIISFLPYCDGTIDIL
ncbi:hypothetical protein NKI61_21750 [Mesorhizobium sp. M0514]|uniref:hypothetical protein n=1 Tax=Mesorhizobium sp. M0514 TaxID=2956955 RepID=UPI00333D9073